MKTMGDKIEFSFGNVETIHDEILDASPEPNAAAIAAHAEKQQEKAATVAATKDDKGIAFDPAIHAVDKDGNPSITPSGKFRKKRGSVVGSKTNAVKAVQDETAARAAGQLAADMLVGGAVTLLGNEWIPVGVTGKQEPMQFDEHSNLRRAFGDYFVAKNITDFPPGIALTIAMTSYAGARLAGGKETKSRLSKAVTWTSKAVKKLFTRAKTDAAHDNSRDNRVRKNDSSKATMQPSEDKK